MSSRLAWPDQPAWLGRMAPLSHRPFAIPAFAVAWVALPIATQAAFGAWSDWPALVVGVALGIGGFLVWPARTLALFVAYMMAIDTISPAAGTRITLLDETLVPIFAAITLVRSRGLIRSRIQPIRDGAVVVFLAAGVLSSLANGVPATIWGPGLVLVAKGVVIFYVALVVDLAVPDVTWVLRFYFAFGLAVLAVGIVELFLPGVYLAAGFVPFDERVGLPVIKSFFYHPQLFGWLCAVVALHLAAHHVVFRRRWMWLLAMVFSVGTILSARRRAIIALVAGLAAGIASEATVSRQGLRRRILRWAPTTAGIIVLGLAFLPALTGLATLTVNDYLKPSGALVGGVEGLTDQAADDAPARVALYLTALRIGRDDLPLGAGLGQFGSWVSREHYSDVYHHYGLDRVYGLSPANPQFITDTFWPQVLGETGVVGLAAYVVFLAVVAFQLWRALVGSTGDPIVYAFVLGTVLVLAQTLVESLASAILSSPSQAYLIYASLGIAIGLAARRRAEPAPSAVA